MTELEIIKAFREPLENHLSARFGQTVPVVALNQPTQQGREGDGRGVYFQFLFDQRHGSQQMEHVQEQANGDFKSTESQSYVGKVQISALWPQNPAADFSVSAKDVANEACMFMNTRGFIGQMRKEGIGVMRITSVRANPISNDRDQYEYMPNFDVDFAYVSTIDYITPRIDAIEFEVHRV